MRNVYLVGPMGSGKTTLGRRLAGKLGLEFHDSDHVIEERTGASINLIFDIEGEAGFRERESKILEELAAMQGVLIATGGGAVLARRNRDLLKRTGIVVYLETPVRQQLRRLRRDRSRPLLQTPDRAQKLEEMAAQRNPLYEEVADLVFPARSGPIDRTIHSIYEALKNQQSEPQDPPSPPPTRE
ncbi:shikimate kinase AroK [Elongatibacter sediminis]|uniref:Shikimate kinase n=1 Tax=Elongatibacter sediminis TaxID=3119006 RepID=A0AAW9RI95_9GAMM